MRRFRRGEDGALAIWSIFMVLMMLMMAGLGIDFMMNEMRRTQLQGTLDRAVLAAADLDQTLDPEAVVQDYFDKAGLGDDLLAVEPVSGLNFRTVSAQAVTQSDPILLQLAGVERLTAPASGTAEEVIPNTEISLVLDISGSMRWSERMARLKPAAQDFISTVLEDDAARTTSVNVVPYAGQTNPGRVMFDYLAGQRYAASGGDYFPEWPQDISNVVLHYDRDGDGAIDYAAKVDGFPDADQASHRGNDLDAFFGLVTDFVARRSAEIDSATVPQGASIRGGEKEAAFFAYAADENGPRPDAGPTENTGSGPDLELAYSDFDAAAMPDPASCLEMRAGDFDDLGLPPAGRPQVPHFMFWPIAADVMDWGWCPEDDTRIQYAQNDAAALNGFIGDMRMHDGTGTHYAMKWALALLDPATRPAFAQLNAAGQVPDGFDDRPSDWNAEGWRKVIVLMTDGQITPQVRPSDPLDVTNATVELQNQPGEARTEITGESTNVQSFYDQCDLAKANGVTVYTIAFEAPSDAQRQMRTCASSPSHYFNVEGLEIADAFDAIAHQINQLRLTQ
ncbi:TadE/TadG family type IV pilus assembly protein [Rhodosalinus sediminis]|nr:Tad domain-containing protein [Rhodosalinus sediminis]